jgi:Golgi nucleoside diphosphatase
LVVVESLRELLNIALAEVPSELQSKTPVSLMATAGLRLLQEGVADNLLNEVCIIFSTRFYQHKFQNISMSLINGRCRDLSIVNNALK